VGGDDAVAGGFAAVYDAYPRPAVGVGSDRELPHRQHVRLVVGLALDERDRPAARAREGLRRRKLVIGHKLAWDRAADRRLAHDTEAQHLRVRKQAFEVVGILGVCGREGGAVERCGGGVEDCQLAPGREIGEVDEQVSALGRREQEPVRRHAGRGAEESVVSPDLP
jgi:hypothetical protein